MKMESLVETIYAIGGSSDSIRNWPKRYDRIIGISFISAYFLLRTTLVGLLLAEIPLRCSDGGEVPSTGEMTGCSG